MDKNFHVVTEHIYEYNTGKKIGKCWLYTIKALIVSKKEVYHQLDGSIKIWRLQNRKMRRKKKSKSINFKKITCGKKFKRRNINYFLEKFINIIFMICLNIVSYL